MLDLFAFSVVETSLHMILQSETKNEKKVIIHYQIERRLILTLLLLNTTIFVLANSADPEQLASRSQLIWICTVCHLICEFHHENMPI